MSTPTHTCSRRRSSNATSPRSVRCVIPVHLFGATVEMDPIVELAREAGAHVVEDACQAHGALLSRPAGREPRGDRAASASTPPRTSVRGATPERPSPPTPKLAERVRLLRAHGENPRYHHRLIGGTARIDALQAAVLRRKLTRLDGGTKNAAASGGCSAGHSRTRLCRRTAVARFPRACPSTAADHVYHLFVVRSEQRDELREHLAGCEIASAVHYPEPIHLTEAYAPLGLGGAACPSASGWRGGSARCRCSRG